MDQPDPCMKPLRILIADDDPNMVEAVARVLRAQGHELSVAENGKTAISRATEFQPDIVITDILMPDRDGYELIMDLRRQHPQVKIIAMSGGAYSGFGTSEIAQTLKVFKVDTFLSKPFTPEELLETI